MTSSDYIASIALIVSFGSFLYTIISNISASTKAVKKERVNYLKLLTRLVNNITFVSEQEVKQSALDSLREELNFCTCYESELSFQEFSTEIDDTVYVICNSSVEEDFLSSKNRCLEKLRSFQKS